MNAPGQDTEPERHALAIGVWENEGGAPASGTPDGTMAALCRSGVADSLLSLNKHPPPRRKDCSELPSHASMPIKAACQP